MEVDAAGMPVWPESIYASSTCGPVTFPRAPQASGKGCPDSWVAIFAQLRNAGHFADMYNDCVTGQLQSAVGMAFRNFMRYVFDGETFDVFGQ